MSQTFGRRSPQYAATWRPEPAAAPLPCPEPAAETPAAESAWKPMPEPEFEAWHAARTTTRWKTWGLCGLIVVGGPMSFLMPEGIGQWAGWGLTGMGLLGFAARFRKPAATPAPAPES